MSRTSRNLILLSAALLGLGGRAFAQAPTFKQYTYVSENSSSLMSITSPAITVAAGDFVVAFCRSADPVTGIAASSSLSNTWNALAVQTFSGEEDVQASWAIMGSAGSTTFTCTPSSPAGSQSMVVLDYSGTYGSLNVSSGAGSISGASWTSPAFTTTQGTLNIVCGATSGVYYSFVPGAIAGNTATLRGASASSLTANADAGCEDYTSTGTLAGVTSAIGYSNGYAFWAGTALSVNYGSGSPTRPNIIWNAPASVPRGTTLSATQLNPTANVAGTFSYSPAAGTVLSSAGPTNLTATFTPTNTSQYSTATASVTLMVNNGTPTFKQYTYVSENSSTVASITSPAIPVAAGDLVAVVCRTGSASTASIAASSSSLNTWTTTPIQTYNPNYGGYQLSIQASIATMGNSGSTAFTCTPSTAVSGQSMIVLDYSGAGPTVNVSAGGNEFASPYTTPSFSPTQQALILVCASDQGSPPSSPILPGIIAGNTATLRGVSASSLIANADAGCEDYTSTGALSGITGTINDQGYFVGSALAINYGGVNRTTPTVTVTPSPSSITTAQALTVTVAVSGSPTPTGSVTLTSGSYTSAATTLSGGGATINIPAGSLATGTDTLTVTYTPDSNSSSTYNSATGSNSVTVTPKTTPTVTVTPSPSSITTAQTLTVTVAVSGSPTPTGSLTLTGGGYTSAATTLSGGGATINIPAGSLATGTDTLTVTYTPDSNSSSAYNSSTGTHAVTVTAKITPTVTVTPSPSSITTAQALTVTVAVSGSPTPTGSVTLTSGSYTSAAATLSGGGATISIAAGSLVWGTDTLTVTYTPDSNSSSTYNSATGTSSETVTTTGTFSIPAQWANFDIIAGTGPDSGLTLSVANSIGGGFIAPITMSASSPQPGFTVTFSPNPIPAPGSGSYTINIYAATTIPGGQYPITLTGTGGGVTSSVTWNPYVTNFSLSASSTSVSVAQGGSGTSTITMNQPGSPAESSVSFAASGQPAGVTIGFNPTTLNPGSTSTTTMTMNVASTVAPGSYPPITVTGTMGGGIGLTQTLTFTLTVVSPQTITFTAPTSPVTYGIAPITLSATANSGLPVTFTIDAGSSGTGTVSGNVLTVTGTGTIAIDANQPGNSTYAAAPQIQRSIMVNAATPTLSVASSSNPCTYGASVTFTATISSGVTGPVTFYDGGSSIGTGAISGTTAIYTSSALAPGAHTITASFPGNTNYNAVTSAAITQTVNKATPVITWTTPANIPPGTALSATQLGASANTPGTFVYSPVAGTVLPVGPQTLSVTFTPTTYAADYNTASATVTLTVSTVPSAGIITTVAGSGAYGSGYLTSGYTGDGGLAIDATMSVPVSVAADMAGNFYFTDGLNNVVRKVTASTGVITTVAGNGTAGYSGDNGPATSAELNQPFSVAVDANGNLYIADSLNYVVRKVTFNSSGAGTISTVAGTPGNNGEGLNYSGLGGPATSAIFPGASGVAVDAAGNLYISSNGVILEVPASTGNIVLVAGTLLTVQGPGSVGPITESLCGFAGDGGPATSAELCASGLATDTAGNLYIADSRNDRIRKVTFNGGVGTITTVAGSGPNCGYNNGSNGCYSPLGGYAGDDGPATSALLNAPQNVAVDASGNLYIADSANSVIRKVFADNQMIVTVAGNGTQGYSGDGGLAVNAELDVTDGVAVSANGTIYIGDAANNRIRSVGASKTAPIIAWPPQPSIAYGTPLSSTQLNASSFIAGNLTYTPAAGSVLTAGNQTLSVTITPTDTTDFSSVTVINPITVNQATPTITWPSPAAIPYGTALSATQLNAAASGINGLSLPGNFTYTPALGTVLTAEPHTLSATFTPNDSIDYTPAVAQVTEIVSPISGATSDTGTVTLTVQGVTAATTTYAAGATPSTIATGLAAGVTGGSFVNVTAVDDAVYLESKQAGAGTNYAYTLQTTSWNSTLFSQPSFLYPPLSGSLEGGANANTSGGTVYQYTVPSGGYDGVGNLLSYSDLSGASPIMGAWTFGYDTLSRLSSGVPTAGPYVGKDNCWSYDAFGNRTAQATASQPFTNAPGAATCQPAGTLLANTWANYNANNQITGTTQAPGGITYDEAGNVLNDGSNQYLYDGDGGICAVASTPLPGMTVMTGYIYDAGGTRVSKGSIQTWSCDPAVSGINTTNDYVLGLGGEQVTEMGIDTRAGSNSSTLAWQHTNVYAAGTLIGTYDNDGLHFYFNDPLGTRRAQTDYAGVLEQTCASLPFGDGLACTGSMIAPTEQHFTGKERDAESGNDYFGARYYASSMGRWLSPDPKIISRQRMYDPQQWDMYSYARNNPLGAIDPDGREVKLLNDAALQRIQSTLPASVRGQVTVGKNGMLDKSAIAGIKSNDPNVKALQTLVGSSKVVEFGTGKSAGGYDFMYQSKEAAQAQIKAAGADPSGQQGPNLYLGLTTPASKSPDGNTQVMVSDGTGAASTAPEGELAATAAHELYGHALDEVQGQPFEHETLPDGSEDPNGAVNKQTQQIEDHTKELQKPQ